MKRMIGSGSLGKHSVQGDRESGGCFCRVLAHSPPWPLSGKEKPKRKKDSKWIANLTLRYFPAKLPAGVSEDSVHSESKSGEKTHTHSCQFARLTSDPLNKWPSGGLVGNAFWNYWRCRAAGMQRDRQREAICAQIFCLFSVGNGDLLHRFRVGADSSRSLGCDCDADYSTLSWITGGYESKKVPSGYSYPRLSERGGERRMKSSSLLAVSHVLLSRWDVYCKLFLTVMRF